MIFVDTGAFIARYVGRDSHHARARRVWADVEKLRTVCYTSNFVLDETFTLLGRQSSYSFAAERARALFGSKALTILRPDAEDELAALDLFARFADQEVSFTDCTSFALMRRHRLRRVFTFDRHFLAAGFDVLPQR